MSSIKYIKKKQRKKSTSTSKSKFGVRLHGAFQGGFSAGHFNTVGSEKGWKPSDVEGIEGEEEFDGENEHEHEYGYGHGLEQGNKHEHLSKKKRKRRLLIQRPEDFMDEEDANEWGGPTKVKQAYQRNGNNANNDNAANANANTNSIISGTNDTIHSSIHDSSSLRKLLYINKDNNKHSNNNGESLSVGKQLLKVLGWREKRNSDGTTLSYAYVPMDDDGTGMSRKHSNGGKEEKGNSSLLLLSTKRLKRIEMQINNASSLSKSKSKSSNSSTSTSTSTESLGYVIKIPPPKIDTYGMGYEPYKNAPEFKAHREMRRLRAEKRARAASSTHGSNRMNVYNMDDLNDDNDNEYAYGNNNGSGGRNINIKSKNQLPHQQQQSNNETQGDILAYETTEDFIGTKTVGGFALHDDDDQVYDNTAGQSASLFNKGSIAFPGASTSTSTGANTNINTNSHAKSKINLNEYANEAYDGSDSDVEGGGEYFLHDDTSIYGTHATMKKKTNNNTNIGRKKVAQSTNNQQMQSFAGALSAWAFEGDVESKNGMITSTKKTQPVTSDGEAPLAGFTLGGSNDNTMKRYPGPDVPADYQVKRHEFSHLDAIATIKLSSLMKRDMKSKRTHTMKRTGAGNAIGASMSSHMNDRNKMQPIAGKSFASLSHALKNRFTASAGTTSEQDANSRNESNLDPRKVKITRTTISWQPSNLLLKRFNINTGHYHTNKSSTLQQTQQQQGKQDLSLSETREEAFFRNDVLGQLETLNSTSAGTKKSDALSFDKRGLSADKTVIERPSLDLMKSIFEPFSEDEDVNDYDDDSDDDGNVVDTIEDFTQENDASVEKLDIKVQQTEPSELNNNEADEVSSQASDSSSSRRQRKKRRKRSSSRRRDKKRKKHKSKKKWKD